MEKYLGFKRFPEVEDKAREVMSPSYADAVRSMNRKSALRKKYVDDRISIAQRKDKPNYEGLKAIKGTKAQTKLYLSEDLFYKD